MRRIVENKYVALLCLIAIAVMMGIAIIQWASSDDPVYPSKGITYVTPEEAEQIVERMYPGDSDAQYAREMCETNVCYIDEHGELQIEDD